MYDIFNPQIRASCWSDIKSFPVFALTSLIMSYPLYSTVHYCEVWKHVKYRKPPSLFEMGDNQFPSLTISVQLLAGSNNRTSDYASVVNTRTQKNPCSKLHDYLHDSAATLYSDHILQNSEHALPKGELGSARGDCFRSTSISRKNTWKAHLSSLVIPQRRSNIIDVAYLFITSIAALFLFSPT